MGRAAGFLIVARAGAPGYRPLFLACSFRLRTGDELSGFDAMAEEIRAADPAWSDEAAIACWLHRTAICAYLESEYAKKKRGGG
jgi:hypothetical protein